jgi:hypothetical protein
VPRIARRGGGVSLLVTGTRNTMCIAILVNFLHIQVCVQSLKLEIVVIVVSSFINFINLYQKAYRFQFKYFFYHGTRVISRHAELRSDAFFARVTTA